MGTARCCGASMWKACSPTPSSSRFTAQKFPNFPPRCRNSAGPPPTGRTVTYWVNRLYRSQATPPESPYSQFIDLDTGKGTDAEGVFRKVYMGDGHVTFQTCIERDGELSWGR